MLQVNVFEKIKKIFHKDRKWQVVSFRHYEWTNIFRENWVDGHPYIQEEKVVALKGVEAIDESINRCKFI
jgi:hypothetical protein